LGDYAGFQGIDRPILRNKVSINYYPLAKNSGIMRSSSIFNQITAYVTLLLLGSGHFFQANAQTSPILNQKTQKALLRQCPFRFPSNDNSAATVQSIQQKIATAQTEDKLDQASSLLNQLGDIYRVLGQYDQSIQAYQQSINFAKSTQSLFTEAASLSGMSHTNVELGEYDQANVQLNQALQIRRSLNATYTESLTLNNLGVLFNLQGQFSIANDYYQQGLTIVRKNDPNQKSLVNALLQGNQGNTQYFTESAVFASSTYDRILALQTFDISNQAALLNNRGLAYQAIGKFDLALQSYDLALKNLEIPNNRSCQWKTLSNRGRLLVQQGQLEAAIVAYRKATDITSKIWRDSIVKLSPNQRISYRKLIRPIYRELAILLWSQGKFVEAEDLLATLKI
jgi:tetratricopeptide (TPR) repeat protein